MDYKDIELTQEEIDRIDRQARAAASKPNSGQPYEARKKTLEMNLRQQKAQVANAKAKEERRKEMNRQLQEQRRKELEVDYDALKEQIEKADLLEKKRELKASIMAIKDSKERRQQIFENIELFE